MPTLPEPYTTTDLFFVAGRRMPYREQLIRRLRSELHGVRTHARYINENVASGSLTNEDTSAKKVIKQIDNAEAPAVIVHGYNRLGYLRIMWACHRRGVPVFVRGDSNSLSERGSPRWKNFAKSLFLRLIRDLTDGAMPVGTRGIEYFRQFGWDEENLFVVPFDIDYEWFGRTPSLKEIEDFHSRYELPAKRKYIMFSGRLEHVKRPDLLIEAFVAVSQVLPEWDLMIAGTGSLETRLRSSAPPELSDRIHWLGWCDQERLRTAYHIASCLVLPSEREAWAIVVNEAIAAGLVPIVSDAVGAAVDLVSPTGGPPMFRSGDVVALAEMLEAVSDSSTLVEWREATTDHLADMRSKFDAVTCIAQLLASLDSR